MKSILTGISLAFFLLAVSCKSLVIQRGQTDLSMDAEQRKVSVRHEIAKNASVINSEF